MAIAGSSIGAMAGAGIPVERIEEGSSFPLATDSDTGEPASPSEFPELKLNPWPRDILVRPGFPWQSGSNFRTHPGGRRVYFT